MFTIKDLKNLQTALSLSDDTVLLARDRDMINLERIDVVIGESIENLPRPSTSVYLRMHEKIDSVYGGGDWSNAGITQAVILCECD